MGADAHPTPFDKPIDNICIARCVAVSHPIGGRCLHVVWIHISPTDALPAVFLDGEAAFQCHDGLSGVFVPI